MVAFQINKEQLVQIVSAAETRKYAEEVELLQEKGGSLNWMVQALGSHQKNGISQKSQDIKRRVSLFGDNVKYQPPLSTFCQLFKDALDDFILKILIIASLLSIIIEVAVADEAKKKTAWIQGFVILLAVAIVGLVTAVNNYSKERQFRKIKGVAEQSKRVTVMRDGNIKNMHQNDVLVGDVVEISQGMEIPADAIVIEANDLTTDQSAMTGESEPVTKATLGQCISKKNQLESQGDKNESDKHEVPSPILMSGTKVLTGDGRMMVIVVGDSSCIGKIRRKINQQEESQTPLQEKLTVLAEDIGKFGLISGILILLILLIRFTAEKIMFDNWDSSNDIKELIGYFILALTVVVVAIPEGLPLSVTLSLAVSMHKMLDDSNLVRRMDACETMGGANNICSDKTGTLTMNMMTLTRIWAGKTIQLDSYKEQSSLNEITSNWEWIQLFKINVCVNSTAMLHPEEKGSSTEIALLKYIEKTGTSYTQYRQEYSPLQKIPFSSARKRMSMIAERGNSQKYIFVKGASEMVLNSCNRWFDPSTNRTEVLSTTVKKNIEQSIQKMAQSSLRTLCLAYKPLNDYDNLQRKDEKGVYQIQKSQLVMLCILGVRDIPRKQVYSAIQKCHRAGIKVRMVTGDNIVTATAIAKDVGIIKQNDNSLVMEGTQFIRRIGGVVCKKCRTKECECALDHKEANSQGKPLRVDTIQNDEQFNKIKDNLLVLARSRPEDKYALVTGLKERGEVVAATGDGTNDAPALKKADVGFAMGIAGTEVAREAAAIILLDDNFNSIVKAVLWGRNIFDSIRKFIQFQLTINIVAVGTTLIGASLIKQQVFAPIQMLWINLIMDTLASLALATEAPTEQLLQRQPNKRSNHIVSRNMMKHILGQSIFQIVLLMIFVFWGELFIPEYVDGLDSSQYLAHPEWKWHNGVVGGTVCSGRSITIKGDPDYQTAYTTNGIYSRHFTFVFNAFVMMQIFNFINCRKIMDEINIFGGILSNKLFIVIVFGIFGLQALLVTFASTAFHVYSKGLTIEHWLICIGIGAISMPVNLLLKIKTLKDKEKVPEESCEEIKIKVEEESVGEPLRGSAKDEINTDSHLIKGKIMPSYRSISSYKLTPLKLEKTEAIKIGFL